jgi:hypothetical protein
MVEVPRFPNISLLSWFALEHIIFFANASLGHAAIERNFKLTCSLIRGSHTRNILKECHSIRFLLHPSFGLPWVTIPWSHKMHVVEWQ